MLIKYLRLYQPSVVSSTGWYYRIWQIIFSPAALYPSQTLFFYFLISHHWITLISIKTWLKILSSICFLHLLCPFHSIHCLVQLNNSMGVLFSYICALIYNLPAITIMQTLTFSWHKYCELFFCLLPSLPLGYPLPCFLCSNCLKMSLGSVILPLYALHQKQ